MAWNGPSLITQLACETHDRPLRHSPTGNSANPATPPPTEENPDHQLATERLPAILALGSAQASARGCSSMVEHELPKLDTWVRFPSPAPLFRAAAALTVLFSVLASVAVPLGWLSNRHADRAEDVQKECRTQTSAAALTTDPGSAGSFSESAALRDAKFSQLKASESVSHRGILSARPLEGLAADREKA